MARKRRFDEDEATTGEVATATPEKVLEFEQVEEEIPVPKRTSSASGRSLKYPTLMQKIMESKPGDTIRYKLDPDDVPLFHTTAVRYCAKARNYKREFRVITSPDSPGMVWIVRREEPTPAAKAELESEDAA